jgi:hypothetical protein
MLIPIESRQDLVANLQIANHLFETVPRNDVPVLFHGERAFVYHAINARNGYAGTRVPESTPETRVPERYPGTRAFSITRMTIFFLKRFLIFHMSYNAKSCISECAIHKFIP